MKKINAYFESTKKYWESDVSFISLLLMLLVIVFILPVLIDRETDNALFLNLMFIILFFIGIFSAREKVFVIASITMLTLHVSLRLVRFGDNPFEFYLLERIVVILNFALFMLINFRLLFRDDEVNAYRIIGAVNVYLSLALIGAFAMEVIQLTTGNSIEGNIQLTGRDEDFGDYIYFSLVSLSTVGFGDVHPVNISSKMLSSFLSVVGILYPAVVIAKLVSFSTKKQ
ncbi:potassium channel family protein [Fontibacter flavus]|uniref:Potassium channel family protein n=1 Tax=Fontibacter flavus TaxID=654838 RepID=A0ABV6FMJ5_9BACT|nr:potassium channel family protein [Cyclobacteriaceae bacterium]